MNSHKLRKENFTVNIKLNLCPVTDDSLGSIRKKRHVAFLDLVWRIIFLTSPVTDNLFSKSPKTWRTFQMLPYQDANKKKKISRMFFSQRKWHSNDYEQVLEKKFRTCHDNNKCSWFLKIYFSWTTFLFLKQFIRSSPGPSMSSREPWWHLCWNHNQLNLMEVRSGFWNCETGLS